MKLLKVKVEFEHGELVYVRTDPDQVPGLISKLIVLPNDLIVYTVSSNGTDINYYDFELSRDKTLHL